MWSRALAARGRAYADGVLTVVQPDGYPASARCAVRFDDARELVHIGDPPPPAAAWRGPACLLFHRHDERLEDFHELQVRGELVADAGGLALRPSELVTGSGRRDTDRMPHAGTPLRMLRFLLLGRRNARRYVAKRGAPWPPVDFASLLRTVREVDEERASGAR